MTVQALTYRNNLIDGVVVNPRLWATQPGYEFWISWGNGDFAVAEGTSNAGLDGNGWTITNVGQGTLFGGDFLSLADRGHASITLVTSDFISSPRIFGSYDHMLQAAEFLGYFPTKLNLEVMGHFSSFATNETISFFGFAGPAVTDCAAAGSGGGIRSGGTASTFFLTGDNGEDAGAAVNNSGHLWRITVDATNTEWFIDEVSQGTIATEADIWPLSFVAAGISNQIQIAWVRIWYS